MRQLPPGTTTFGTDSYSTLFARFAPDVVDECVVIDREGTCLLERCDRGVSASTPTDAGAVTLAGALEDVAVEFDASSYGVDGSNSFRVDGPLFAAGDAVTLANAGSGEVPAMSTTLEAPPHVTVTKPAEKSRLGLGGDIELAWTSSGGAGKVVVAVWTHPESSSTGGSVDSGAIREGVRCEADVDDGSIRVPATLLQQLRPNLPSPATLGVVTTNREAHERGGWRTEFELEAESAAPSGGPFLLEE